MAHISNTDPLAASPRQDFTATDPHHRMKPVSACNASRLLLGLLLLVISFAKFMHGHRPEFGLPAWILYGSATMEMVLAALLFTAFKKWASLGAAALFAGATLYSWLESRPCGCLGGISDQRSVRIIIAAGGGLLAISFLALLGPARNPARSHA